MYGEVAQQAFRRRATYRGATVAGVFTNSVFGIVQASILVAVFVERAGTRVEGLSVSQAVAFTFVTQGLLMVIGVFGDRELANRIKSGDVIGDLYRPLNFQLQQMATTLGGASFSLIFRGLPPFLIGLVLFDEFTLPASWTTTVPAMLLSIGLGAIVAAGFWFALSLTAFWLLEIRGVLQLGTMVIMFGSGTLLPLQFFPHWGRDLLALTPFPAMAQMPVETYLELHRGSDLLPIYAQQLLWVGVMYGLGAVLLRSAMRKVVIQGG